MTIETASHIDEMNDSLPAGTDDPAEGDNHIRQMKTILQTDFPNINAPVTSNPTELNYLDGTSKGQITAGKAIVVNDSGNLDCNNSNFTNVDIDTGTIAGAVTGVTQSPGDNSTKLATTAYADAVGGPTYYTSANFNPTLGSDVLSSCAVPIAHGLGAAPEIITVHGVCQSADGGFAAGDVIQIPQFVYNGAGANYGIIVTCTSTTFSARIGANGVAVPNITDGTWMLLVAGKWACYITLTKLP